VKALDVLGTAAKAATAAVKRIVQPAGVDAGHRCDGFHCDCGRRAEVAAQSREASGAWLSDRSGWLNRGR
jgi:hypothetical protein